MFRISSAEITIFGVATTFQLAHYNKDKTAAWTIALPKSCQNVMEFFSNDYAEEMNIVMHEDVDATAGNSNQPLLKEIKEIKFIYLLQNRENETK